MELQKNQFALAAAKTMGAAYVVCGLFVWLWPDFASTLLGWLTHLTNLDRAVITFGGFVGGLIQIVVYTYIGGWLFAWLHNRSVK